MQTQLVKSPLRIEFYRAIGKHGFLSNLFKRNMEFEGRVFPTAEHAYQFGKPKDPKVREWIMSAPKPHLVSAIAHALLSFDINKHWSEFKVNRMRAVLKAKFTQHEDLKQKLLATRDKILIEKSKTDAYWGIGKKGNGKNLLGRLLMELREELRGLEK